jgi:hypothetical protein
MTDLFMTDLFYPQLSTGALAQYPVKRSKTVHTAVNRMEDGSKVLYFDTQGSTLSWNLEYTGLTQQEMTALQTLFENCAGGFRVFTFLDPVGNLLGPVWQYSPLITASGLRFTNTGITTQEILQTLPIPAGYIYTFSLWDNLTDDPAATVTINRRGPNSQRQDILPLAANPIISSGALNDTGNVFTIAVQLQPGQTVDLTQAQLEAQPSPSPFRPATGGVYTNAHWAMDELIFVADGLDSFQTKFTIETHV